jgi:hypothetical protein
MRATGIDRILKTSPRYPLQTFTRSIWRVTSFVFRSTVARSLARRSAYRGTGSRAVGWAFRFTSSDIT